MQIISPECILLILYTSTCSIFALASKGSNLCQIPPTEPSPQNETGVLLVFSNKTCDLMKKIPHSLR
ncbi:hypothetical protein V6Z11_D12G020200 [Gossypium hirsutum]